jgi:hypothetical protein
MSLPSLTQNWLPRYTHKSLSNLDAGVAILATSFVSYQYPYVPGGRWLSHILDARCPI